LALAVTLLAAVASAGFTTCDPICWTVAEPARTESDTIRPYWPRDPEIMLRGVLSPHGLAEPRPSTLQVPNAPWEVGVASYANGTRCNGTRCDTVVTGRTEIVFSSMRACLNGTGGVECPMLIDLGGSTDGWSATHYGIVLPGRDAAGRSAVYQFEFSRCVTQSRVVHFENGRLVLRLTGLLGDPRGAPPPDAGVQFVQCAQEAVALANGWVNPQCGEGNADGGADPLADIFADGGA